MPKHRKLVRHWDELGHIHEVTFSCYQRRPLLLRSGWPNLLSRSIDAAMRGHNCDLIAFVYMPEHVHLLVQPKSAKSGIANILYAIKRPFSFRVKESLIAAGDGLLMELTIRERPGKMSFRFWQEGPGYDRNIFKNDSAEAAAHYIHRNPVRRGLCGHPDGWKWSSFRHYEYPMEPPDADLPTVHGFPV